MKKGVAVAFVCLSIFLLMSMSFVSAGWFDNFWGRITGNPVDTCFDTDNGINYGLQGSCTGPGTPGTDYCIGASTFREYYCGGASATSCVAATFSCDSGQSCNNGACITAGCGNNVLEAGEGCDDGNTVSGDGCNAACMTESFLECTGNIPSNYCDQFYNSPWGCNGNAPAICANRNCNDDGQGTTCSDCDLTVNSCASLTTVANCNAIPTCMTSYEYCGDGIRTAGEDCDDDNNIDGDGCSMACEVEAGYTCAGMLSVCTPIPDIECGNNILEAGEDCDDGNTVSGDGCSATCGLESGTCAGTSAMGAICTFPFVVNDQTECTTINSEYCSWTGSACAAKPCSNWNGDITGCGNSGCTWDPAAAQTVCGNGIIEGTEECDGANTNSQTCSSQGLGSGNLACNSDCTFSAHKCSNTQSSGVCGNEVVEGREECDGPSLNSQTCSSQGFDSGQLGCNSLCRFDTSNCGTDIPNLCTDEGDELTIKERCVDSTETQWDHCYGEEVVEYECSSGDSCVISNAGQARACSNGQTCQDGACIGDPYVPPTGDCEDNECFLDNLCYPIGYRVGGDYCEITGLFVSQSAQGVCNNHFECSSNLCVDGACIEPGFFQRLIQWFRGLFS